MEAMDDLAAEVADFKTANDLLKFIQGVARVFQAVQVNTALGVIKDSYF